MSPRWPIHRFAILAIILLAVIAPLPPSPVHAAPKAQPSTPLSHDDVLRLALAHLRGQPDALQVEASDLADLRVSDLYSDDTGLTFVYLQQYVQGLPIHNALVNVTLLGNGDVLFVGNRAEAHVASRAAAPSATLRPSEAVSRAAAALGLPQPTGLDAAESKAASGEKVLLGTGGISLEPIPVRLMYQPTADGALRLAWDLSIYPLDAQHWWSVRVDAATGELLSKDDWVVNDTWGHAASHATSASASAVQGSGPASGPHDPTAPTAPDSYKVYPLPVESPIHTTPLPPADGRSVVANPADGLASPYGWHDTNGAAGADYTITRGNNAHAYTDTNADNSPDTGSEPSGGATLDFNFPLDLTQAPSTYQPAAVTNLFYLSNATHDLNYRYGFTEAAGNFQANNYGRGGAGSDYALVEAQDGSGTNNANFATPPDGSRPRMQMYIWDAPTPDRDGDLDAGIVLHEYGHGISNRLTGGPSNTSCLTNSEQMGEGWSDWQTLVFTALASHTSTTNRGVGTYALNQPITGTGIRAYPYNTNMTVDPRTYVATRTAVAPHGVGSIWTTMLWEVYWNFVNQYGFDANLATGTGGNNRVILLVNEAMKLQPCSPGFVDGRNAILAADVALYGGPTSVSSGQASPSVASVSAHRRAAAALTVTIRRRSTCRHSAKARPTPWARRLHR